MSPFDRFEAISFDCYGTLIDWESGILTALRPVMARHRIGVSGDRLLRLYGEAESGLQADDYRPYKEILQGVVRRLGERLGFSPTADDLDSLVASVGDWPPFPDTVAALRDLKTRYRLIILSNIDDDLFAGSQRRLQIEFDWVTTAERVRSYKPRPDHFTYTLDRLGLPRGKLLHAAQSLFHDIAPARALGLATVWVNRRQGKEGSGATPPAEARPDLEVPDLRTLADLALSRPNNRN